MNVTGRTTLLHSIGFTCFWPNGGGLKEFSSPSTSSLRYQQQNMWECDDGDVEMEEFED